MKKFSFRLQKVLEYRRLVEEWAKDAYLDARANRLEAEMGLIQISEKRHAALQSMPNSQEHRELETKLQHLDDKEIEQQMVVNVLLTEEEKALHEWTERRVELQALEKLRDKQVDLWEAEMNKKMQAELDEWALRKKAA